MLVAIFLASMDNIAISTALPRLRQQFAISHTAASWIINAYTLPFAVCMLAAAALAVRSGQERVFRLGAVTFGVASLGCALSQGFSSLVAARAIQGLSAAALVPIGTSILIKGVASPRERARRVALVAAVQGTASVTGPFLGGVIVEISTWRMLFAINVPLCLALFTLRAAPAFDERPTHTGPLWQPLVLSLVGLGCCVGGLLQLHSGGLGATATAGLLGIGVVLLALFLRQDARAGHVLLPAALRASRRFHRLSLSNLCVTGALFAAVVCLLELFQSRYSPLQAGALTLPCTAMPILAVLLVERLTRVVSVARVARLGAFLQGAGLLLAAVSIQVDGSYLAALPGLVLTGFGVGLYAPSSQNLAFSSAPERLAPSVSALSTTTKETGILLGAVLGAVLVSVTVGNHAATAQVAHGMPAIIGCCAALSFVGLAALPRRDACP